MLFLFLTQKKQDSHYLTGGRPLSNRRQEDLKARAEARMRSNAREDSCPPKNTANMRKDERRKTVFASIFLSHFEVDGDQRESGFLRLSIDFRSLSDQLKL